MSQRCRASLKPRSKVEGPQVGNFPFRIIMIGKKVLVRFAFPTPHPSPPFFFPAGRFSFEPSVKLSRELYYEN